MARQPKTRQPKRKFEERKRLKCGFCHLPTSSFHIATVGGKPTVVCKSCATDTYTV